MNHPQIICVGNVNPSGHGMNGNVFYYDGLSPTLTTNKGEGIKLLVDWGGAVACSQNDTHRMRQSASL